jgi:hypothetical protein
VSVSQGAWNMGKAHPENGRELSKPSMMNTY